MGPMSQLYSIKLGGGSNKWRCDCNLRPLIRKLVNFRSSRPLQAQMMEITSNTLTIPIANVSLAGSLTILDDEPHCYDYIATIQKHGLTTSQNKQLSLSTGNDEKQVAIAWTNMSKCIYKLNYVDRE